MFPPDRKTNFVKKSLLAARIILRDGQGRLTSRDRRWAGILAKDSALDEREVQDAILVLRFPAVFARLKSVDFGHSKNYAGKAAHSKTLFEQALEQFQKRVRTIFSKIIPR